MNNAKGFTLLEVLLALAIISISLTAILRVISQNITYSTRLADKTMSHWVAQQGITMVQLGLLPLDLHKEITQSTIIFDKKWYWRAELTPTEIKSMQKINISTSPNPAGTFINTLTGFKYTPIDTNK